MLHIDRTGTERTPQNDTNTPSVVHRRRLETTASCMGRDWMPTLRSWATGGKRVSLVALVEREFGALAAVVEYLPGGRATFTMERYENVNKARERARALASSGGETGLVLDSACSGAFDAILSECGTLRTAEEAEFFRLEVLGRRSVISNAFREAAFEDSIRRGRFFSERAADLLLCDLFSLALSGPDSGQSH